MWRSAQSLYNTTLLTVATLLQLGALHLPKSLCCCPSPLVRTVKTSISNSIDSKCIYLGAATEKAKLLSSWFPTVAGGLVRSLDAPDGGCRPSGHAGPPKTSVIPVVFSTNWSATPLTCLGRALRYKPAVVRSLGCVVYNRWHKYKPLLPPGGKCMYYSVIKIYGCCIWRPLRTR